MNGKMTVQRIGVMIVGLLSLGGCRKQYLAAGPRGDFDFSGSYSAQAQPVADGCEAVSTEPVESRLDVEHPAGALQLTIVFEGDPYPASVKRDGKFASATIQRSRGGTVERVTMRGRLADSTLTASLDVQRAAVRPVLPTSRTQMPRACRYHVNLKGTRTNEPRG
jgi:hypothetical protein